jgi:hypothetical protein
MTRLPLTALVHEGPMSRAYLGLLRAQGHRLERIVLLVQSRDAATRRPVLPWLPAALRRPVARLLQDMRMNHWPRQFLQRQRAAYGPWLQQLAGAYGVSPVVFDSLTERPDHQQYADVVQEVLADGLGDPAVAVALAALPARSTVLFTGGGMVPASLLALPNCRFIHVHPGVLPDIRGADGLLWSLLVRGRPGATAFYMAPGLDTGDIIQASDLDLPPLPPGFADLDPATAYRLLYAVVDPLLRAVHLGRVIAWGQAAHGGDLFNLPAQAQQADDGRTFHFMHARLRQQALARLLPAPAAGKGAA